jgi:glycerol uptake facilitator protein
LKLPALLPCCIAEFLGVFILVFLGCGVVHAATLTDAQTGLWQVAVVWGIAVTLAVFVVGSISGGHINPAMTIAFAVRGMFPWSRVGPYVLAQVLGGMLAAGVLFVLYQPWIEDKETSSQIARGQPGSENVAKIYGEYFPAPGGKIPNSPHWLWHLRAFVAEWVGTMILALVVFSLIDAKNTGAPAANLAPVFFGLTVAALISVLAPITQACFNPARDLGPRLVAWLLGWGTVAIPGPNNGWLSVYVVAPILGAITGAYIHRFLLRYPLPASQPSESSG